MMVKDKELRRVNPRFKQYHVIMPFLEISTPDTCKFGLDLLPKVRLESQLIETFRGHPPSISSLFLAVSVVAHIGYLSISCRHFRPTRFESVHPLNLSIHHQPKTEPDSDFILQEPVRNSSKCRYIR
jgi:hypothetical protein